MTPTEQLRELEHGEQYKDKIFVYAKDIAPVFGCKPETLTKKAKNPGDAPLPFSYVVLDREVRFVKQSFINYCKGRKVIK